MEFRNTKQRSMILEILQGTKSHPTANWIYDRVKKEFPNISMGTVYRNLGVLEEMGKIQRLSCGATFDRYDANVEPHMHFACRKCHKLIDIEDDIAAERIRKAILDMDLVIDNYDLTCYGVCKDCQNNH